MSVPIEQMQTRQLVDDYERRKAKSPSLWSTDGNDLSRAQKMINRIVDELLARADRGDLLATLFFDR